MEPLPSGKLTPVNTAHWGPPGYKTNSDQEPGYAGCVCNLLNKPVLEHSHDSNSRKEYNKKMFLALKHSWSSNLSTLFYRKGTWDFLLPLNSLYPSCPQTFSDPRCERSRGSYQVDESSHRVLVGADALTGVVASLRHVPPRYLYGWHKPEVGHTHCLCDAKSNNTCVCISSFLFAYATHDSGGSICPCK